MNTQNETLVRNFYADVWNQGHIEAAGKYYAEDYVDHNPAVPGQPAGLVGAKAVFSAFLTAFPDLTFTVDQVVSDGDKIAARYTAKGTNTGSFVGMPPTGRGIVVTGIELYRIAGGKVAERWGSFDQFGLMAQLGAIPAPAAS